MLVTRSSNLYVYTHSHTYTISLCLSLAISLSEGPLCCLWLICMLAFSHWLALSFQCNNASVPKEEGTWTSQQRLTKKGRLFADRGGLLIWGLLVSSQPPPLIQAGVSLLRDTSPARVLSASPGLSQELRGSSLKHGTPLGVGLLP